MIIFGVSPISTLIRVSNSIDFTKKFVKSCELLLLLRLSDFQESFTKNFVKSILSLIENHWVNWFHGIFSIYLKSLEAAANPDIPAPMIITLGSSFMFLIFSNLEEESQVGWLKNEINCGKNFLISNVFQNSLICG